MAEQWQAAQIPNQSGKIAVVTGANSGIGLITAQELARKGAHVILTSRSREKGEQALQTVQREQPQAKVELVLLDLASLASIHDFAGQIVARGLALDILCNNAGIMATPPRKTADGFELQFGTNHLGHFALTGLLLEPLLRAPAARVVTVSSGLHRRGKFDFDNLDWHVGYDKWAAYARSKLANLLFAFELQRKFVAAGAKAISVAAHPGFSATNLQLTGFEMEGSPINVAVARMIRFFGQPAAIGALPTLYAATAPGIEGGDYTGPSGFNEMRGYPHKVRAINAAYDPALAARLWQVSEELTGVRYRALEVVVI